MKEKRNEESAQDLTSGKEGTPRAERRRSVENDSEPGVVRVKLPMEVGIRVKEVLAELKVRGAQITIEEFLAVYLESIPPQYFETQLIQRTPDHYYLDAATKVPELREMLIRQAKKGLMKIAGTDLTPRTRRKYSKKSEGSESQLPGSPSDASH